MIAKPKEQSLTAEGLLKSVSDEFGVALARTLAGYPLPEGICGCGCGGHTPLAVATQEPTRFVPRHHLRPVRVIYDPTKGCWLYSGGIKPNGYGQVRGTSAHRRLYEAVKGAPDWSCDLDHLCRVRSCQSPNHLEEVSRKENARRGSKAVLTKDLAKKIRELAAQGDSAATIAANIGVNRNTVAGVIKGYTWIEDDHDPVFRAITPAFRERFTAQVLRSGFRAVLLLMLDSKPIDSWLAAAQTAGVLR